MYVHCGSTAQQQSAFTLEAGPTRETTALCKCRWSWVGFTREAESPCPRVEGPTPQRSGVALPTGGRADPAVGNEALAGTRRSLSTAQQQSPFTLEAGPTRETTALCKRRWSWVGFTREAESPCPRVEGPTPQLATKRSLVPGVLFFFRWYQALAGTPH